jgi:hypothetical protein
MRWLAEIWEKMTMNSPTSPICPLPGLGYCVRERCNFWDEAQEECTAACYEATEQESGAAGCDAGCLISFCEDFD